MIFLGIDLGGTKIAVGAVNEQGKILKSNSLSTFRNRTSYEIITDIISLSKSVIKEVKDKKVEAVGIGVPGPVDVCTGTIVKCVNLGWKNVPIERLLTEGLNLPSFAGNDATLAGIAEMEVGTLKGVNTGVMLTLGTGIGGAVICEGKIQHGAHNIASELGHMIVGENEYDCSCGHNGCLETFTSALGMNYYAKKLLILEGTDSLLMKLVDGMPEKVNGIYIFKAAKEGDPLANKVVDHVVKYLAIGIVNIATVIDPEVVAIGGGISKAGEFLLDKLRAEVLRLRYFPELPICEIKLATLGNEAGIVGAAMLAKQRTEN